MPDKEWTIEKQTQPSQTNCNVCGQLEDAPDYNPADDHSHVFSIEALYIAPACRLSVPLS